MKIAFNYVFNLVCICLFFSFRCSISMLSVSSCHYELHIRGMQANYIISFVIVHVTFHSHKVTLEHHIHVHACVCYYFCHGQLFTRLYITLYFFNILLDSSFVSTTILICFLDVYLYNNYYVDCFENHYRENIYECELAIANI